MVQCMSLMVCPATNSICYSDASKSGCASVLTMSNVLTEHVALRNFTDNERAMSSTHREMLAVFYGLCSFQNLLDHKVLHWFTDNASVVRIVRRGSMKADLHILAYKIFRFLRKHKIQLAITWIPRDLNQRADFYSKIMDFDDWFVSDFWFDFITRRFGIPDIDRFADADNKHCSKFNSRYYSPGSLAVDSFTQHWGGSF